MGKKSKNAKILEIDDLDNTSKKELNINVDEDDSIESMFKNEINNNQESVKELFYEDKVKARTDLSSRQIKNVTKAYYLGKLCNLKEINYLLNDFLTLRISDDRKSRKEYVEALKSKIDNDINRGMMNVRGQFGKS